MRHHHHPTPPHHAPRTRAGQRAQRLHPRHGLVRRVQQVVHRAQLQVLGSQLCRRRGRPRGGGYWRQEGGGRQEEIAAPLGASKRACLNKLGRTLRHCCHHHPPSQAARQPASQAAAAASGAGSQAGSRRTRDVQEALGGGLPGEVLALLGAHGVRLVRQRVLHVPRELVGAPAGVGSGAGRGGGGGQQSVMKRGSGSASSSARASALAPP